MYAIITAIIILTIILKFRWFLAFGLIVLFALTHIGVI